MNPPSAVRSHFGNPATANVSRLSVAEARVGAAQPEGDGLLRESVLRGIELPEHGQRDGGAGVAPIVSHLYTNATL